MQSQCSGAGEGQTAGTPTLAGPSSSVLSLPRQEDGLLHWEREGGSSDIVAADMKPAPEGPGRVRSSKVRIEPLQSTVHACHFFRD